MKFFIRDFFRNLSKSAKTADMVTFTEEILNGKPNFLCRDNTFGCCFCILLFIFGLKFSGIS